MGCGGATDPRPAPAPPEPAPAPAAEPATPTPPADEPAPTADLPERPVDGSGVYAVGAPPKGLSAGGGRLWVGHVFGFAEIDPDAGSVVEHEVGLIGNLTALGRGAAWIDGATAELRVWDGAGVTYRGALDATAQSPVAPGPDGSAWVGTRSGVYRIHADGRDPLLVATPTAPPLDLAARGDGVVWSQTGGVFGASADGAVEALVAVEGHVPRVAVSPEATAWIEADDWSVHVRGPDGDDVRVATDQPLAGDLVLLGARPVWTMPDEGVVRTSDGAGVRELSRGGRPRSLAVTDDRLCWTDETARAVRCVPVPLADPPAPR